MGFRVCRDLPDKVFPKPGALRLNGWIGLVKRRASPRSTARCMMRCTLSQSRPSSPAALFTSPHAWITSMAKASNMSVKREYFPAQGTAVVFAPQALHFARGTRVWRAVSNCIVSKCLQERLGVWSAMLHAAPHSGHVTGPRVCCNVGPPFTIRFAGRLP